MEGVMYLMKVQVPALRWPNIYIYENDLALYRRSRAAPAVYYGTKGLGGWIAKRERSPLSLTNVRPDMS